MFPSVFDNHRFIKSFLENEKATYVVNGISYNPIAFMLKDIPKSHFVYSRLRNRISKGHSISEAIKLERNARQKN